jgi:hypothetical protein
MTFQSRPGSSLATSVLLLCVVGSFLAAFSRTPPSSTNHLSSSLPPHAHQAVPTTTESSGSDNCLLRCWLANKTIHSWSQKGCWSHRICTRFGALVLRTVGCGCKKTKKAVDSPTRWPCQSCCLCLCVLSRTSEQTCEAAALLRPFFSRSPFVISSPLQRSC